MSPVSPVFTTNNTTKHHSFAEVYVRFSFGQMDFQCLSSASEYDSAMWVASLPYLIDYLQL